MSKITFDDIRDLPEWQAFSRDCGIKGLPDAEIAEITQTIDDETKRAFIAFATNQQMIRYNLLITFANKHNYEDNNVKSFSTN